MGYIVLPILGVLVLVTLILLIASRARYKWVSAAFLIIGLGAFFYISVHQSKVCTEYFCGLKNVLAGWIISFSAFVIALVFAIVPRKK